MKTNYSIFFIIIGLISLFFGLIFGLIAGLQYSNPLFLKNIISFNSIRPLHTLFVVSWILLTSIGGIYFYTNKDVSTKRINKNIIFCHFWIFILTGFFIALSFLLKKFGGKEYLEFSVNFYFPIIFGWILFAIYYFKNTVIHFKNWKVYHWMWATGIVFMIYHFTEAHLWYLSDFKDKFIQNIALQWKAGGSYVGSWNMMVYGTAIYLMEKINNDEKYSQSKKAFFFYFLGLTNLMFGWAHHIYIVPTAPWIRYFAYMVSMTEWIVLVSIIHDWKKSLKTKLIIKYTTAYNFLILSDFWIFLNIILALLISIPAINIFTHGTHITVAHSMGTTIGINTLILLSSISYIIEKQLNYSEKSKRIIQFSKTFFNISFLFFWIALLILGIKKSTWLFSESNIDFGAFYNTLYLLHIFLAIFGFGIFIGLSTIIFIQINYLLKLIIKNKKKT